MRLERGQRAWRENITPCYGPCKTDFDRLFCSLVLGFWCPLSILRPPPPPHPNKHTQTRHGGHWTLGTVFFTPFRVQLLIALETTIFTFSLVLFRGFSLQGPFSKWCPWQEVQTLVKFFQVIQVIHGGFLTVLLVA